MDPFIQTPPGSNDYVSANSLLQFAARLIARRASPFRFGRLVHANRNSYFVDVVLGVNQRHDYLAQRVGLPACTHLRIYMLMRPEEYERASNIFLAARLTDAQFPTGGIITNNYFLPVDVCVAPGGVWIEICDTRFVPSRLARRHNMFAQIILATTYGIRDNYVSSNDEVEQEEQAQN